MSLIMKIDVKAHIVARRDTRQHAGGPANEPDATGLPGIEPAVVRANAVKFTEDFILEHSSSNGIVAPVAIAGESSEERLPAVPESPQP